MQLYLEETMESLWQKLQDEVNAFNNATREKRHIYNELLLSNHMEGIVLCGIGFCRSVVMMDFHTEVFSHIYLHTKEQDPGMKSWG